MLKMRDVSNYQGNVHIAQAFPDSHIIACKATEGTGYASPAFQRQWLETQEAGKARMAYHFFHPSIQVAAQVRYFLDTVMTAGLENGDMVALDHESTDGLPPDVVAGAAVEFTGRVDEETKGHCTVYTFLDFAKTGNCAGLGRSPLWIADPSSPPGKPEIPPPWERVWDFHQYGITRGIDDDLANFGNLEALLPLGVLVTTPAPGPDERIVWLSDGTQEIERVIPVAELVQGYSLETGSAVFKIL